MPPSQLDLSSFPNTGAGAAGGGSNAGGGNNDNSGLNSPLGGGQHSSRGDTPRHGSQNEKDRGGRSKWTRDVQLITMTAFSAEMSLQLGGIVSARAIKYLDSKSIRREVHDEWWNEVRTEVRSHARALNCPFIVGYAETMAIFEDVCVLSAIGTAAKCARISERIAELSPHRSASTAANTISNNNITTGLAALASAQKESASSSADNESPQPHSRSGSLVPLSSPDSSNRFTRSKERHRRCPNSIAHIPYVRSATPFKMHMVPCGVCEKHFVPELLLTTIEPPGKAFSFSPFSFPFDFFAFALLPLLLLINLALFQRMFLSWVRVST